MAENRDSFSILAKNMGCVPIISIIFPEKRLEKHTLGTGSKFVRSWRPFELVKTIPCKDATEARKLEGALKKLTRKKKIEALELQP